MRYVVANVILLVPALIVLIKAYEINGAAAAVLGCLAVTTLPAVLRTLRLLQLPTRDLVPAVRSPLLCSAVVGAVLALLLPVTSYTRPFVSLILMAAVGLAAYLASTALFARSVVGPMWLDLRGTRS